MDIDCRLLRSLPLRTSLSLALGFSLGTNPAAATILPVSSCADDGSAGTLRHVIGSANAYDTIDLHSQLSCSAITLASGEIIMGHNLTLEGPADRKLTIVGDGSSRIFEIQGTAQSYGSLTLKNLSVSGGRGQTSGGCILASVAVALDHSNVSDCTIQPLVNTHGYGGAVDAPSVSIVNDSHLYANNALTGSNPAKYITYGGGAFASAQLSCSDSTISGNFAAMGGGLATKGAATITRCTIDTNQGIFGGGIAHVGTTGAFTVTGSTVSGNGAFRAAGIYSKVALSVYNTTVATNTTSTTYVAGILALKNVTAQSCIIAHNLNSAGNPYDLMMGPSTALLGADNAIVSTNALPPAGVITVTADPHLAPLGDHGGSTRTHALLATSPAFDHGNNSRALLTDQRGSGFVRIVGAAADIGAYERQAIDDEIFFDGFE
jgi:hypothetical protein